MPQPRVPSNVLKLRGGRSRVDRSGEPAAADLPPLGKPSKYLDAAGRAAWREIVASVPPGTFCAADQFILELASRLLARLRTEGLKAAEFAQLQRMLSSCGLTPTDRSKLAPPAPPKSSDANPWDSL